MKKVILYTMKGCSHCDDMKESLKKSKIKFIELDLIAQKTTLSVIWNKKNTNPMLKEVLQLL